MIHFQRFLVTKERSIWESLQVKFGILRQLERRLWRKGSFDINEINAINVGSTPLMGEREVKLSQISIITKKVTFETIKEKIE